LIRTISTWNRNQRGAALLIVLMSLALLFSLGVPFLFTGQKRAEAARESFDRSRARVGVSSAGEHVRWMLADTHPALDSTPWWDSQAEWQSHGLAPLPQALGGAWAKSNDSWGVETESAQSLVSLATASPLLLQNLLHPCFLTEDASFEDSSLAVTSTEGFSDAGFVLMGASWVEYQTKTSNSFDEISVASDQPDDLSATRYREGQAVIDQRVLNLVLARMRFGEQRAPEFFDDVFSFDFGDPNTPLLPEGDRRQLADLCWLSTGAFGEARMQPAVWASGPPPEQNPNYLPLQDATAFSTGTMVRIENQLIGLSIDSVVLAGGRGGIMIPQALPAELDGWTTRATPFRRDPVDINSCRREILEAMVLGLRFNGSPNIITTEPPSGFSRRHYVTRSKAQRFADMVINARPIEGPDDLWARVLQPALRRGELSHADVWSIHLNGLDPNHGNLAASTTGFAYRSGDRFVQRVNAAHRSRLGRTLSRASAVQDVQVAPSGPLLQVWETQQDFEEAGRYARGLHKVVTLPNARGRLGGHADGQNPDGLTLRVGSYGPTPFAPESDAPELSALLPMPAEDHWQGYNGRVEHFPAEPSPLGWNVGKQGPRPDTLENFNIAIDGETGGNDDVPLTMQAWFRMPEFGTSDGVLFEIGGDYVDRQRIVAAFEQGSLFVRAYDNAGDDPSDEDNLEQALTIEIDPAEYPLENRWFHVGMLLRSVRAGGVQAIIDGVPRGKTHGFTNLTGALSGFSPGDTDPSIAVESTEGFPSRGVIRIGEEVIEYSSKTKNGFVTSRVESADGYLGGRAARVSSDSGVNLLDTIHPKGAGVELYGYSAAVSSDIPPGGATLTGAVGPWSVAHVVEGEEAISIFFPIIRQSFRVGYGITGSYTGPIELAPAEATDNYYANCFQETGGYALMMQRRFNEIDDGGHNLGGFEIIRYSGRQGTTLTISERQVATPRSQPLYDDDPRTGTGVSFVTQWDEWLADQAGVLFRDNPTYRVFIMPISIAGDSVTDLRYLVPNENNSEFVQITNESDAGLTEWVRYDSILDGYFLRDDPGAMINAISAPLFDGNYQPDGSFPNNPPGSGGGGVGGGGAGGVGSGAGGSSGTGGMLASWQEPEPDNQFTRRIGGPIEDRPALIIDIMRRYQFRGVMGTFDHEHLGGEDLVPVFRTRRPQFATPEAGQIGRLDRVAIMDPTASEAPFWFTVQWATAPFPIINEPRVLGGHTYVALSRSTGIPYAMTVLDASNQLDADSRDSLRLVKFPSGERPNGLRSVFLGSSSNGAGGVFGGEVDEVVIGQPTGMPQANGLNRSAFVLRGDLESGDRTVIRINPNFVVVDGREVYAQSTGQFIQQLPEAGLLWIDGELIAYNGLNAGAGELEIAPEGRGLLGTEPGGHASGTRVWAADMRPVAFLNNGLAPGESQIQLNNSRGFGPHSLLLVDDELLHAPTLPGGNVMMMDRYPEDADNPDSLTQRGDGLFRGAFGTTASTHATGAMVYSMPTRWMDLYAPRQNSQESAWYQLGMTQPGAFWQGLYFEAEEEDASHQVMVLARSGSAAWEDDPESTPGLVLIDRPQMPNGSAVPLNLSADNLELRVLFDWTVGAFDPVKFLSNGWTIAPRLRHLRLEYLAESRVVRSQEVHE
jgi:uncharacterized membrane protein YgcG